jgi:hypothetical protein
MLAQQPRPPRDRLAGIPGCKPDFYVFLRRWKLPDGPFTWGDCR